MKKVLIALLILVMPVAAKAEGPKKLMDNSFLIEEAYNQEPGVIQHIQTFQYLQTSKSWAYTFTQEWPVPGQTHQLSYTIPVNHFGSPNDQTGIGDIAVNYRYQALMDDRVAFSPRLSLLLPSGDYKKGLGTGATGIQTNLPLSVDINEAFTTHWNFGGTYIPGAKEAGGSTADTMAIHSGFSFIYFPTYRLNLMLEAVWDYIETPQAGGGKTGGDTFFINPGLRFATDFESGLQMVSGIAFPIGVGPSKGEYGVFLYLSLEHPFFSPE